jgi:hypothetical protein
MKVDVAALEQGSVHAGGGTDSVTLGTGVAMRFSVGRVQTKVFQLQEQMRR